ncbi:MAG TPA: sporulation protein [Anaerolineae bacterium]|nr:sporulation protein [Anaerolineae bacterium]
MSTINKLLSAVGIGAAKIQTTLHQDHLIPGQSLSATITITGGQVPQTIDAVYLYTTGSSRLAGQIDVGYHTVIFDKHTIANNLTIQPGEEYSQDVTIQLTYDTPLTVADTEVYITTALQLDAGLDADDQDKIIVNPTPRVQALFDSLKELGFNLHRSDCEDGSQYDRRYVQEFEFKPTSGEFKDKLSEIELICLDSPSETSVYLQIDRRPHDMSSFIATALDLDESHVHFRLTDNDLPTLTNQIAQIIRDRADGPLL